MTSLQQRLPQLAAALKAATAAGTAMQANLLALVDEANKKCTAATSAAVTASMHAAGVSPAVPGEKPPGGAHKAGGTAGNTKSAGSGTGVSASAGRLPNSNQVAAATSNEQSGAHVAAAESTSPAAAVAAAAGKPDVTDLAAVSADLQSALGLELMVLQQRLGLLGSKSAALIDELVQLKASAMGQLAEWQHKRYVAECGAVSALERIVKAAAAAGKPLAHDLRLEVGGVGLRVTAAAANEPLL
jgi:hypothetical protein